MLLILISYTYVILLGGGVTIETNQRLHVAYLDHLWNSDVTHKYNGFINAKIVGWNFRDKKICGRDMGYIDKKQFSYFGDNLRRNFTPIYEQSIYKYILYIEGHCAACRYGFMMNLGSVILKVTSKCVADQMWYFPLLKPYVDHVPVKDDLSDLGEVLEWCRCAIVEDLEINMMKVAKLIFCMAF